MSLTEVKRISSIDLLKGIVMVLMALDHTRDYFHWSAYVYAPEDPDRTTLAIFFTRWITHFCAPAFSFLAGVSAYLSGKRKTKKELSLFLLKRGLWLILIELTVVNFAWYFDIQFRSISLIVIWALGVSMIVLAGIIHFKRLYILIFSCVLIFGHDILDSFHSKNYLWAILHEGGFYEYSNGYHFSIGYPIIPWIAVMSLGFYFGFYYDRKFDGSWRKKNFNRIGLIALALFFIGRAVNIYGDPFPWKHYNSVSKEIISFMNPNKYPPSLLYILMTLGVTFIFLANFENVKNRIVNFFTTFGRVPFFYYVLHLYLIHFVAMIFAEFSGYGWESMIWSDWGVFLPSLKGFGFNLVVVYLVWAGVIGVLYPVCKKFDQYKSRNRDKWWLSYW